jgi:hypothetical protein
MAQFHLLAVNLLKARIKSDRKLEYLLDLLCLALSVDARYFKRCVFGLGVGYGLND